MKRFITVLVLLASAPAVAADFSQLKTFTTADGVTHGLGLLRSKAPKHGVLHWSPVLTYGAPAEYDLRTLGLVSPIKDQGGCGSCWAFSLTKTHESARLKAGVAPLSLSEQAVVSCDTAAYGCNGGMMSDGDWIAKNGQPLESEYPYQASDSRCQDFKSASKPARYFYVGKEGKEPTTEEIKAALQQYGVLSVVVSAGGNDWSRGGDMNGCRNRGQNHMVNIAGWVLKGGKEKYVMANSWAESWGDHGFGYLEQGCDEFATGSESVSGMVVDGGPAPTPPHVQLPAEVDIMPGTEVMLGVKSEPGVSYSWTADGAAMADTDSMIYVTPAKDTVYQITAKTAAGTAQSSVKVHVLPKGD